VHQDYLIVLALKESLGLGLPAAADAEQQGVGVCLEFADSLDHARLLIVVVDQGFDVVDLHGSS
jgi:anti-sigma regulatory factor (Ser/Thr protein kinase)